MFNLEKAHILIDEMVVNGITSLHRLCGVTHSRTHSLTTVLHLRAGCITESSQAEVLDQLSLIDLEVSRGK
jgi:hypothetical protein